MKNKPLFRVSLVAISTAIAYQSAVAGTFQFQGADVQAFGSTYAPSAGPIKFDRQLASPEALLVGATTDITTLNTRFVSPESRFTGVGGLLVSYANGSGSTCTGSLISSGAVLTAAHCLNPSKEQGVITSISFFLPSFRNSLYAGGPVVGGDANPVRLYGTDYALHPNFIPTAGAGGTVGGSDIALVYLQGSAPTDREIYGINRSNNEIDAVHTKVGAGTRGFGSTGTFVINANSPFGSFDGRKRFGNNIYEYTYKDVFGQDLDTDVNGNQRADADSILFYDFDSGLAVNDVFGRLPSADSTFPNKFQTGVLGADGLSNEVGASPGDSGGPTFVNGLIAGITSFGFSAGFIFGEGNVCGGAGNLDTARAPGVNGAPGSCTNSSFGEISADTRVSAFADWVDAGLAGSVAKTNVPLPGSVALLGVGLIGLLGLRRKA